MLKKKKIEIGGIIGIHGNKRHNFRIGIFLDNFRIGTLYERNKSLNIDLFDIIFENSKRISKIKYNNELCIEDLSKCTYEIYNLNLFKIHHFKKNPEEFLEIIKFNLSKLDTFNLGDIIKFEGFKLFDKFVLYHHHAIFSGMLYLIIYQKDKHI
jgi:hypothetical protein